MDDRMYEITTTQMITGDQIDDVVTTALEGGITHWCDGALAEPVVPHKYAAEMLTLGSTLRLHEQEEDKWHDLTLDKLLDALSDNHFDFDNYDAGDVDNVVQKAIFGEVVYG